MEVLYLFDQLLKKLEDERYFLQYNNNVLWTEMESYVRKKDRAHDIMVRFLRLLEERSNLEGQFFKILKQGKSEGNTGKDSFLSGFLRRTSINL